MGNRQHIESTVVMGIGGAGSQVLATWAEHPHSRAMQLIHVNTDAAALRGCTGPVRALHIGPSEEAAGSPAAGGDAAHYSAQAISRALHGATQLYVLAGLGGGTGTGACVEIARMAIQQGLVVKALVLTPFGWEGAQRQQRAQTGVAALHALGCALTVVSNADKAAALPPDMPFDAASRTMHAELLALGGLA